MKQSIALLIIVLLSFPVVMAAEEPASVTTVGNDLLITLVNQLPDPAQAGDILEFRVGIENQGQGDIEDLVIELIPGYPFQELQGEPLVRNVGTIKPYQVGSDMKIIKFKVRVDREVLEGTYDLTFYQYYEGNRETRVERVVPVDVQSYESVEVIYIDKAVLNPGERTPMVFTINNVGSSPLRNLQFSWENEDGVILPVGSTAGRYIDYVEVGDKVELNYDVIASTNAEPDLYKLILALEYENPLEEGTNQLITNAGIYIGGGTAFEVSLDDSSGGETSVNIANVGSNPASAVSVIIPEQQGWHTTGANTAMIGSLTKGDYTIASFQLQGGSVNPLKVEVVYTDTMGNRLVSEHEITLGGASMTNSTDFTRTGSPGTARQGMAGGQTAVQSGSLSSVLWQAIFAVLGLAVIIGGVYYYKGRRKKK